MQTTLTKVLSKLYWYDTQQLPHHVLAICQNDWIITVFFFLDLLKSTSGGGHLEPAKESQQLGATISFYSVPSHGSRDILLKDKRTHRLTITVYDCPTFMALDQWLIQTIFLKIHPS